MTKYQEALLFAAEKHKDHKRKNGMNYIIHPIRVSREVKTETQQIIALLHDTVEDTDTTFEEIEREFGTEVRDGVDSMTHRQGESYIEYIARLKLNPDAVCVKIADIVDNLSDTPSENAIKKSAHGLTELVRG